MITHITEKSINIWEGKEINNNFYKIFPLIYLILLKKEAFEIKICYCTDVEQYIFHYGINGNITVISSDAKHRAVYS